MEISGFRYSEANKITGVEVTDLRNGGQVAVVKTRIVVNAAGPWVDRLRALDTLDPEHKQPQKRLHLTKGIHLVVPYERLPLKQSVYFDNLADGRMLFAIPRGRITYIGTTDTNYNGDIDRPNLTQADQDYVLQAANEMFPSVALTAKDVISSWAGLRPLIHERGKSPSELSRKDEIFVSSTGLVSIAGGKLTGYRKMAERVTDRVVKSLGLRVKCGTKKLVLSGGDFSSTADMQAFFERVCGECLQIKGNPAIIRQWVQRYGRNTEQLVEYAFALAREIPEPDRLFLRAEIKYLVEHEMVHTLNDFLIRRTGQLYFDRDLLVDTYPEIGREMAQFMGWDEQRYYRELAAFKAEFDAVVL